MSDSAAATPAASPDVCNVVGGDLTGPTVQAGTIHGGVHYHQAGPPRMPMLRPRQLPAPPSRWVDREVELADLDRALAGLGRRRALTLVTGLGGIGKSALALRWGHQTSAAFPDGQLYADLGAAGPTGPLPPPEVLGRFLRALSVPARAVPVDEDEQAGLWRTLSADRRLLIVLDNAASAAQVRPLLPTSPGSMVVVTTRTLLEGLVPDGARVTTLQPLDETAALALLDQAVGDRRVADDQAAATSLVRLCSGIPIALTVVASRLATHPRRTLSRLVADLADHHRLPRLSIGDVSVTAAFDMSYNRLTPPAARCYRLVVGLHPGSEFATPLATAVLGLTGADTAAVLDELRLANLLTQITDDRYSYHDLVGAHARRHAVDDPEYADARRRLLTWYLAGASAADQILTGYRRRPTVPPSDLPADSIVVLTARDEALDWLDSERPNLVATVRAMAVDLPELAYLLADAMWPLFLYGRHHHDRMQVDRIAVDCARRLGNHAYEAAMLRRQGYAYYDTGRFTEAQRLFEESLQIAETVPEMGHVRAASVAGLGIVALAQRDLRTAQRHFTRELQLTSAAGDSRSIGFALLHLGQVSRLDLQANRAVDYLSRATAVFADLGDIDQYNGARVRIELGRALADNGKPQDGATEIRQALAEMTQLRSPRGRAEALHALGELALAGGQTTDADTYLTQATEIYDALGDAEATQTRHLADQIRGDFPQ